MTEVGSRYLQYIAAAAGNLNIVAVGAILGWTSPILPKLEAELVAPDNPLNRPISKDESSWIGSLVPLGIMFGTFVSGYLGEWLGRKRSLLLSTFPFILGWILLGTAKSITQMYIARFILGFCISIPFTVLPMYIGEISEAPIRGALGSFLQLFLTFGFLFSYSIGPYVSYGLFWILCSSLHVGFHVCYMFMPESPYYLLSCGRNEEAVDALTRFRGVTSAGVKKEIEEIKADIEEASRSKTSWSNVFKNPVDRKAILLTAIMMSCQEFMGIDVVLFYVEQIFRSAGTNNTELSAIIIGLVQMFSSIICPFVVDRSGRKILLIISSLGSGITVGLLGAYFYLKTNGYDVANIGWVPLTTLIIYMIAYGVGWGPLPWAIMGEMFGPGVKTKASSICVFTIHCFSFLLTKLFPNIEESYGPYWGFWFFSICCAANIIFLSIFFPETKGKTLQEIQEKLKGGKNFPISNVKSNIEEESP